MHIIHGYSDYIPWYIMGIMITWIMRTKMWVCIYMAKYGNYSFTCSPSLNTLSVVALPFNLGCSILLLFGKRSFFSYAPKLTFFYYPKSNTSIYLCLGGLAGNFISGSCRNMRGLCKIENLEIRFWTLVIHDCFYQE